MTEVWLIGGMMAVTFAIRYTLFAASGQLNFPEPLARALKYVPPTALTAIIVPSVLMPNGTIEISTQNAYLVAGLAAFAIGWFRKNLLLTIIGGMGAFFLWRLILSSI